ncbi:MAG: hypothetical protein QXE81_01130 [Desulfurococcaceae archaeon]
MFESGDLEKIRDFVVKSEIGKFVEIRQVDNKYPYIYALIPSKRGIDRECLSKVESMLSRGEISQSEYKRYRRELVEQCIISLEKERVKEIVSTIENYVTKIRQIH